ncbi:MAG TPA: zf-HC2 domain-containing protein, partial [Gemmatimonadaceae bacterium]|nr:zf-HC2 domain-containing protein [Gemmatimonadaceae bacterium]
MTKCTAVEIRESLPDLIHAGVSGAEAERIEAHVAACADCREELRVLRTVHGAAVFAPSIDTQRIVRAIPPYAGVPVVERPSLPGRSRPYAWLAAAGVAIALGTVMVLNSGDDDLRTVPGVSPASVAQVPTSAAPGEVPLVVVPAPPATVANAELRPALALAGGLDDLSDGSLVALMTSMET